MKYVRMNYFLIRPYDGEIKTHISNTVPFYGPISPIYDKERFSNRRSH